MDCLTALITFVRFVHALARRWSQKMAHLLLEMSLLVAGFENWHIFGGHGTFTVGLYFSISVYIP